MAHTSVQIYVPLRARSIRGSRRGENHSFRDRKAGRHGSYPAKRPFTAFGAGRPQLGDRPFDATECANQREGSRCELSASELAAFEARLTSGTDEPPV